MALINLLWWLGCTFALIGACTPVKDYWDPLARALGTAKCIKLDAFVIAAEIPESLLDFVIIGLPVGVLRKLQLPLRHKIPLVLIFAMGGFVGVVGFVRIAITYKPQSYSYSTGSIWLIIQLGTAVICCCLPTYKPILPGFEFLAEITTRFASLLSRGSGSQTSPTSSNYRRQNNSQTDSSKTGQFAPYIHLGDNAANKTAFVEGRGVENTSTVDNVPLNSIRVQRSVDVV